MIMEPEQFVEMLKKTGLKRDTVDKFYTKKETVDLCIEAIKEKLTIDFNDDLVIEPSAGNGAFIEQLKTLSKNCIFIDKFPEHQEIIKKDFLKYDAKNVTGKYKKIHIIGNPPFGRQASTAIKIIKKACSFCDTLSLILPKSFRKESMHKYVPINFHLLYQMNLPEIPVKNGDKEHNIKCVFQIWIKKDTLRIVMPPQVPMKFSFVKKIDTPDISFRRVGRRAGFISEIIVDKNPRTHYFIKFKDVGDKVSLLERLRRATFDEDDTVAVKSIGMQEVIVAYNKILDS